MKISAYSGVCGIFTRQRNPSTKESLGWVLLRIRLRLGCFIGKSGDVEVTLGYYRPSGCYLEWVGIVYG